jgi:glucokinase
MAAVLALDVGGTKLAAAVVDDTGRILGRGRVPSPQGIDPEELYEALLACAAAALRGADVAPADLDGIGVAAAGPMVWPSGEVSPLNMPAWRGFPLRKRLAEEFDAERVLIHNDAVGLTVGEHWRGAGSGTANLLGMTVSTGVGGGLILGGRGCLEAIASGPNTVRHALDDGWRPRPGVVADGVALAAAAAAGDAVALRHVARAGTAVGTAIASCASLLDLEVAAIVGGFSQSGPSFWEPLRQAFAAHAGFPFAAACRVVPGQLTDTAGLLGAAAFALVPERYGWDPDPAPGH